MLLIDAVYINVGGGKVLLDYLIHELEKTDSQIFYLLDKRIVDNHPVIKSTNTVLYLNGGFWDRQKFYRTHKNKFDKIFCLGNIPPVIRQSSEVITYFHNPMYLEVPEGFNLIEKFKYLLKVSIIKFSKHHTSWWVQSDLIKTLFLKKYNLPERNVKIIPFYPPFSDSLIVATERKKNSYIYVSNATPNKNHIKLLEAFCMFYDAHKLGELTVTVNDNYPEVVEVIYDKIAKEYPVKNIGFVKRNDLKSLYLSHEYLIFPSLAESFGLGFVEAIENGCKVLGADLPYTYAVCEPSLAFNPYNVETIYDAFVVTTQMELKPSVSKIENKINDVIAALV